MVFKVKHIVNYNTIKYWFFIEKIEEEKNIPLAIKHDLSFTTLNALLANSYSPRKFDMVQFLPL